MATNPDPRTEIKDPPGETEPEGGWRDWPDERDAAAEWAADPRGTNRAATARRAAPAHRHRQPLSSMPVTVRKGRGRRPYKISRSRSQWIIAQLPAGRGWHRC